MSSEDKDRTASIGSGIESAALRKYLFQIAGQPDPDETNVVEAARMAAENFQEMEERLAALEGATGINLENAEWKQLSRVAKIRKVRKKLVEKAAEDPNGKAAMDYNDITWLFDGHPSPGHASELVKAAGDAVGYSYEKHEDRNNRVTVDLEKVP